MSHKFWPDAVLYFSYTWNCICHKGQSRTPFEFQTCHKPSIQHLKAFGTMAYVGVPKVNCSKLDARAKKGIMIGYALKTKGYKIWLENESKLTKTINVKFNDDDCTQFRGAVMGPWCELEEGRNGRIEAVDISLNFCPEPSPTETNSDEDDVPVQHIADGLTDSSSSHILDDSPRKVS